MDGIENRGRVKTGYLRIVETRTSGMWRGGKTMSCPVTSSRAAWDWTFKKNYKDNLEKERWCIRTTVEDKTEKCCLSDKNMSTNLCCSDFILP